MKKLLVLFFLVVLGPIAQAEDILDGDERLACEAILCLSSGQRPSECIPSLRRYFGISKSTWDRTIDAREDFLNQCPASNHDSSMGQLVRAIARGAGRCDPEGLNTFLRTQVYDNDKHEYVYVIGNTMPAYCDAYHNHEYTYFTDTMPMYVGVPLRGGKWVEASNYATELAAYNARIAAEDAARCAYSWDWSCWSRP